MGAYMISQKLGDLIHNLKYITPEFSWTVNSPRSKLRFLLSETKRNGGHTLSKFRDLVTMILFIKGLSRKVQGLVQGGEEGGSAVTELSPPRL